MYVLVCIYLETFNDFTNLYIWTNSFLVGTEIINLG